MERIVFLINEEFSVFSTYFCAIQFPNYFHIFNEPTLPGRQPWEQSSAPEVTESLPEAGQDQDLHVSRVQGEVRGDQHPGQEHGLQGEEGRV